MPCMEPARTRRANLKLLAEHFARRGVLGASMSAIARDAGITAPALPSLPRQGLLAAAVTRREANSVLEALGEHRNPEEALAGNAHLLIVVAGVPTPVGGLPNNPTDYLEWMLERTGMPINDRTASFSEAGCNSSTTSP